MILYRLTPNEYAQYLQQSCALNDFEVKFILDKRLKWLKRKR